jgi:hypothetical protein
MEAQAECTSSVGGEMGAVVSEKGENVKCWPPGGDREWCRPEADGLGTGAAGAVGEGTGRNTGEMGSKDEGDDEGTGDAFSSNFCLLSSGCSVSFLLPCKERSSPRDGCDPGRSSSRSKSFPPGR